MTQHQKLFVVLRENNYLVGVRKKRCCSRTTQRWDAGVRTATWFERFPRSCYICQETKNKIELEHPEVVHGEHLRGRECRSRP